MKSECKGRLMVGECHAMTQQEQEYLQALCWVAWSVQGEAGTTPEQVPSQDALAAASDYLSVLAQTDGFAGVVLAALPQLERAFQTAWRPYAAEQSRQRFFEERGGHLATCNFAVYEREKYRVDAYDQRNGQRWFLDAVNRLEGELQLFHQHGVAVTFNENTQRYEVLQ
jgi:hypothetical protein